MKFHDNKRPFKCPHCPKRFVLRQNLTDHISRHLKITGGKRTSHNVTPISEACHLTMTSEAGQNKHIVQTGQQDANKLSGMSTSLTETIQMPLTNGQQMNFSASQIDLQQIGDNFTPSSDNFTPSGDNFTPNQVGMSIDQMSGQQLDLTSKEQLCVPGEQKQFVGHPMSILVNQDFGMSAHEGPQIQTNCSNGYPGHLDFYGGVATPPVSTMEVGLGQSGQIATNLMSRQVGINLMSGQVDANLISEQTGLDPSQVGRDFVNEGKKYYDGINFN